MLHDVVKVLYEYKKLHIDANYVLDKNLLERIDDLLKKFPDIQSDSAQISATFDEFFSQNEASFPAFSSSRHCCRDFSSEEVSIEAINSAIKLAINAPSACNRQPNRVYVIKDKETISNILRLQGGNRGFGETITKLIIICGYLGGYSPIERNCVFIDTGIFTMNLAYSLHYYKIGCCILNWSVENDKDLLLRKIVPIRNDEVVSVILGCGMPKDNFKLCYSEKQDYKEIITEI